MKALQLIGTRQMTVVEVTEPQELGPEEILIRVKAIGICGTDVHYYRGESAGYATIPFPFTMGHEFAGLVEAVGSHVTELQPGDRVALDPANSCRTCEACLDGHPHICPQGRFVGSPGVPGAMQELVVHPARLAFKLPENLSYAQGAVLEPLGVGLHAVNLGRIRIGDTVAVLGCGPIGLFIVQLARLAGAQDVFATDVLDHRLQMAEKCGAGLTINPTKEDPVRTILGATRGRGVDVAFEVAGALETPEQAAEVSKACGTVVVVGICSEDRMPFRSTPTRRKGLTIKVSRRMPHVYPRIMALSSRHMVDHDILITHTFPLEQGAEAFRILDRYEDGAGKVVILNE
jgi:L-iditol 2-dehydrogenase